MGLVFSMLGGEPAPQINPAWTQLNTRLNNYLAMLGSDGFTTDPFLHAEIRDLKAKLARTPRRFD